jgi:phospholipid-binding lipoprotein MlaA
MSNKGYGIMTVLFFCCALACSTTGTARADSRSSTGADTGSNLEDPFETKGSAASGVAIRDPLEKYNRFMFAFNDKLYFYVLKPVAQGYGYVMPEEARKSVKRFFTNLATPVRLINCLLQGKVKSAGIELSRCVINSTGGFLGFFDPAYSCWDLKRYDEDTGQTLGVYRLGHGLFIIWPFFGPSSIRDTVGMAGDIFLDPLTYVDMHMWQSAGIKAFQAVNATSLRIGEYEDFKAGAIDPYVSLKNGYIQYRDGQVKK